MDVKKKQSWPFRLAQTGDGKCWRSEPAGLPWRIEASNKFGGVQTWDFSHGTLYIYVQMLLVRERVRRISPVLPLESSITKLMTAHWSPSFSCNVSNSSLGGNIYFEDFFRFHFSTLNVWNHRAEVRQIFLWLCRYNEITMSVLYSKLTK